MAHDPFARMDSRLLSRLGKAAVIHGATVTVFIEHGVEVTGEYGEVQGLRTVISIPLAVSARRGDRVTVGMQAWQLESPIRNDGLLAEWVVRDA